MSKNKRSARKATTEDLEQRKLVAKADRAFDPIARVMGDMRNSLMDAGFTRSEAIKLVGDWFERQSLTASASVLAKSIIAEKS